MSIRLEGPETPADRHLREWFDEQERGNVSRLEEGAKTIIQLVTGLYGVLFAVLALSDEPAFLQRPWIQNTGTIALLAYFSALLFALAVVFPSHHTYQEDNLSSMQRSLDKMLANKLLGLQLALIAFLVGTASLALLVLGILRAPFTT